MKVISFLILLILFTSCSVIEKEKSDKKTEVSPDSFPWVSYNPGLKENDGSAHVIPGAFVKTGVTIDVTQAPYSCVTADDANDDRPGIEAAMNAANEGDELYFPNGVYNLKTAWSSDVKSNIRLKTKVNLRGQSQGGAVLKTDFDDVYSALKPEGSNLYYIIRGYTVNNIHIKNLTLTSAWNRSYSTNTSVNNTDHGGPNICILLEASTSGSAYTYNIYIENVTVEKFVNIGIRVDNGCHDAVLKNCTARNATDVAGGGCGYGFQLSGNFIDNGLSTSPNLGNTNDNYWNMIDGCITDGSYLRHSALIQYWAHNNLITNCNFTGPILDAIDLHGEDEFNNEVSYNTVNGSPSGAGVGAGNSGGGGSVMHDKSGPHNYIHHNMIINCKYGITVQYNTPYTKIENNTISGYNGLNGRAIILGFAPFTTVKNNIIQNNSGLNYNGIRLTSDTAMGLEPAGSPENCIITDNSILNNTNGTAINIISGINNIFSGNIASGNANNTLP